MDELQNRRLAQRREMRVPVRIRVRSALKPIEDSVESQNLSQRGVFFHTDLLLSEGTAVDLLMEMRQEITEVPSAHWLCTGHVVRVVGVNSGTRMRGVGVQFDFYEVSRSPRPHWAIGSGLRGPFTPRTQGEA